MLSSYKLMSHPKKFLKDHLLSVGKNSFDIANSKFIDNKSIYTVISYVIGVSHDFGKATTCFQKKLEDGETTKYANHGFLSSLFAFFITKRYLEKINKLKPFEHLPFLSWIVVKRHHGNIKNIDVVNGELEELEIGSDVMNVSVEQIKNIRENNFSEITRIYESLLKTYELESHFVEFFSLFENENRLKEFIKEIKMDGYRISRNGSVDIYLLTLFFYSILLDSDKLDASDTKKPNRIEPIANNTIDTYKKKLKKDATINTLRESAYKEVMSNLNRLDISKQRLLSIELPTGMGKTLTGLSAAIKIRNMVKEKLGFYPRIIYSLPFLSIIDQNSDIIEKVFGKPKNVPSNLFLKHHHLAEIRYAQQKTNDLENIDLVEELDPAKSILLTESWHSEIIMTTFVQFFESIITNKNKSARKLHNIVNSIIILDEIQSIPTHYWNLFNKILKALVDNFNCTIILMTATRPLIFDDSEIVHLIQNRDLYYGKINRANYNFTKDRLFLTNLEEKIIEDINSSDNDIMCILNTIKSCKSLYKNLKAKYPDGKVNRMGLYETKNLILINLSTHLIPKNRLERIKLIKKSKKRKIIVTTQLIEAGVDISVDKIYRDMAPLDCIIQAGGRCNRENSPSKGKIEIINLIDDKTNRSYASYIYDNTLVNITRIILEENQNFDESRIKEIITDYYRQTAVKKSSKESTNIMSAINQLRFSDIAAFALIENCKEGLDVIVELDKVSITLIKKLGKVLEKIKKAEKEDKFKLRAEASEVKRQLNNYTLSVSFSHATKEFDILDELLSISSIKLLNKHIVKDFYEKDTGLKLSSEEVNII